MRLLLASVVVGLVGLGLAGPGIEEDARAQEAGSAGRAGGTIDRVAALVNDDVITLSEVYELGGEYIGKKCSDPSVTDASACVRGAELEVLDALIERSLMRQELDKLDLAVTSDEVDRAIDRIARDYQLEDRDALRREVEATGLPWESYREQLTDQLRQLKFTDNVIRPRVAVSDNEIEDLYKRTVRDYAGPATADLSAFMVALPPGSDPAAKAALATKLQGVIADLNGGKRDWAQTVQELDAGAYAPKNGQMGTFKKGELKPEIDQVAFGLQAGQVGGPIDLGNAFMVVRVDALHTSDVLPLEKVKDKLQQQIFEQKVQDETEQWYQQARRKAAVKILLEPPGA